jgi:hypothetical protein
LGKTFKDMKDRPRAPRKTKSERIKEDRDTWNKQAILWLEANEDLTDLSMEEEYFLNNLRNPDGS